MARAQAPATLELPPPMPAADADGASSQPAVSAGGRYVAFRSEAENLVFGDSNGVTDVFVRDRVTAQTTRVSVSSSGGEANGHSSEPAISFDGRYVAFSSDASDLVSGDSNGVTDVFVHDLLAGETTRASLSSGGAQADAASSEPAISADGNLVAFSSVASNLVAADANTKRDVFLRDRVAAKTTRVSVPDASASEPNGDSSQPSLSGAGDHVAFTSAASNLVSGDSNAVADVFVRGPDLGDEIVIPRYEISSPAFSPTARVSLSASGAEAPAASSEPSISADGRFVAFTYASDLPGSGDLNSRRDVYVRDRTLGGTAWASKGTSGLNGDSHSPSVSGEGGFVAFVSGSALQVGDQNGLADVYERELTTDFTTRLSIDDDLPEANGASTAPSISVDGTYAAFSSEASNLAGEDANSVSDILLHTWGLETDANLESSQPAAPQDGSGGGAAGCGPSVVEMPGSSTEGDAPTSYEPALASRRTKWRCDIDPISPGLLRPLGPCADSDLTARPINDLFLRRPPKSRPSAGDIALDPSVCRADPVNTATGSYITQLTDLALPGIGLPFELERTYNSGDPTLGPLGRGWTHSYAASLSIRGGGAVVVARGTGGQQLAFTRRPGGSYAPTPNGRSALKATAGGYELTRRDQLRYRFNHQGKLIELVDRNGQDLDLAYNASGQLERVTDTVGRQISFSYTSERLSEVALPDARKVSYAYTNGLLTAVTDVRGGITRYEYTAKRISKVTDQNGHAQISNSYSPGGRVISQTDALGKQTSYDWDLKARTTTLTDPRGKKWRDSYSKSYELLSESDPLGNESSYKYDRDSNVIVSLDPRGHTSKATYDGEGNKLTETDALGHTAKTTYNSRNDPVTHTNRRGFPTAYDYDGDGNLTKLTEPGAVVTSFGRDPAGTGLLKSTTDPRGKTETYAHDGQGNLSSTTSPKGFKTSFGYDGSGRLTSTVEPRGNVTGANPADYRTSFGYDAADHPTSQLSPLGHETRQTYDPAGKLKTQVDAKGRTTSYGYDALNRLTLITAPDTTTTAYGYSSTGELTSRTDANNHTTNYAYDPARRLESKTSPAGRRVEYLHDEASNLVETYDARQYTTTYAYDRLDRLTEVKYPGASTASVSFGYDQNSNRVLMRDGEGDEASAYDQLDRLSKLVRGTRVFSYDYDAASNLTQRRYPDGRTIDYGFDDDNRLSSATSAAKTTSYAYDAASQLTQTTLPNGYQELKSYDRSGRLSEVENRKGASVLSKFTYTRDQLGNPTTVQSPGSTTTYAYDALDRVKEACYQASCLGGGDPFIRYGYDPVGNRSSETRPSGTTSYSHNADDELTSKSGPSGTTSYDHDSNGNLTRSGSRSYAYDAENRTTSTSSGSQSTSYRYDGDGTRMWATTGPDQTQMVWDKNNALPQLIAEENAAGEPKRRYLHGAGLISMNASGQDHYYHRDGLGSTTNLTDAGGGAEWSHSYEPFGDQRQTQKLDPQAPENPIRFAGERLDEQSGLYHLRARDLDPSNGRFTATDPLSPGAGAPHVSAYAYADNRPTALSDPSGLRPGDIVTLPFPVGPGGDQGGLGDLPGEKPGGGVAVLAGMPWGPNIDWADLPSPSDVVDKAVDLTAEAYEAAGRGLKFIKSGTGRCTLMGGALGAATFLVTRSPKAALGVARRSALAVAAAGLGCSAGKRLPKGKG